MLANATGSSIVNRTTTVDGFKGPPLIAVCPSFTTALDPKWVYLRDVIAPQLRDCPIIGCAPNEPTLAFNACLVTSSRFHDASARRSFVWSDGKPFEYPLMTGPIIAMPTADTEGANIVVMSQAWGLASRWHRTDQNHPYKYGMQAIGPTPREGYFTPPVYKISHATWRADLDALISTWLKGGQPTVQDLQALGAYETGIPGISRHVNPILMRFLVLEYF